MPEVTKVPPQQFEINEHMDKNPQLPPVQQAIRNKCFHPSGTFVEFPVQDVETSIPARFEKIACLHSQRIAVKTARQALTYTALNESANRVAWSIYNHKGANPEPVLLLVQDSVKAIVSLLGVFKAGKILIVADPAAPWAQLREITESSRAAVLVTDGHHLPLANALATRNQQIIDVDALPQASATNLELSLAPDSVAQIVFSSGSTGSAKGIVFSHRNILHRTRAFVNATHICPEDRIAELRKPAFGAGIIGLFRALLTGAGMFPYDVKEEGLAGVARLLNQESISLLNPGAAIFRSWASEVSGNSMFPSVRLVNVGGAPVFRRDVEAYKRIFASGTILVHTLACSEAGYLSIFFVDHDSECATAALPAGYPLDDQEIFIVDEKGMPAEPGEVGEIAVKSRYLSVGYWHDDQLTRSRFLAANGDGEKRTFLTGDLGRMLPDGRLFHLERKDFQRKIRGYRVSLVEIETTLLDHPAVKESAVATWENDAGETLLAAYIIPQGQSAPSVSELRSYLQSRLSDYKIPSAFVFLDAFPQANGKVDRRSLPRPRRHRPDLGQPYAPAATATERQLAEIWEEILNLRPIGIHDEFFELGGDSLAAARVVSRVLKHFQLEIPLRALFDAPTIAAMARLIANCEGKQMNNEELEQLLSEVEAMTEEEAQRLLAQKGSGA